MNGRRQRIGLALALLLLPSAATEAAMRHRPPPDAAPPPFAKPEPPFPVNITWTLAEIDGKPVPGEAPTFLLDDKFRATGFSGCNTYSMAMFPIRNQKLAAGAIAVTRKQCSPAEMLLERRFLVGLHSLPTWAPDNDTLVLTGPVVHSMRFRRGI